MNAVTAATAQAPVRLPQHKNMPCIPGGTFWMGSEEFYPEEKPVHQVSLDGFWMDEHPVTVAEFRRFVKATGYRTTGEVAPAADDYPGAGPSLLVPGSLVFRPSAGPVPLDDYRQWWTWAPGADWRHPEGPSSGPTTRGGTPAAASLPRCQAAPTSGQRLAVHAPAGPGQRHGDLGPQHVVGLLLLHRLVGHW